MTTFADQLFTDLMLEHGSSLATTRRPAPAPRRHPVRVAGGLVGAAAAATTGIVLFTGGSPAYALTDNPNGSVTLEINKPSGIAEANEAFAARGDRVVVVPVRSDCPDIGSLAAPADPGSGTTTTSTARRDGSSITLDVQGIPANRTALVGVDSSGEGTWMGTAMISGAAPECVSLAASPPPGAAVHQKPGTEQPGTEQPGTEQPGTVRSTQEGGAGLTTGRGR
jgi:hypothetical protein